MWHGFCYRLPYGLAVRIPGFHPGGPGSTPGKSFSPSSSLNSSEEDLCAGVASSETPDSTAKLGDTHKLEAFIADLDQILKEI
ncbi:uncharacterized protein M6D78_014623 isoform 3-T3 [Vipera latastei]